MSRQCNVCKHYYAKEINVRLLNKEKTGDTFKAIARDYQGLDEKAVSRHYKNHLVKPEKEPDEAPGQVDLKRMLNEAAAMYYKAVKTGDPQTSLKALSLIVDLKKLVIAEETLELEKTREDHPVSIKLVWGDDLPKDKQSPDNDFETVIQNPDSVIEPPENDTFEDPGDEARIEEYRQMAEDCKPVKIHVSEDGHRIDYIETPAGRISNRSLEALDEAQDVQQGEPEGITSECIDDTTYITHKARIRRADEVLEADPELDRQWGILR